MKFIALGGADSVGASCYFLQIDGHNFLLDCGKGFIGNSGITYGPDFTPLIPDILTSLSELDAIFISHGHYDHIGYLPEIIDKCPHTPVFATRLTRESGMYLMIDRYYEPNGFSSEKKIGTKTGILRALNRITTTDYLRPVKIGSVRITFYEAGHIPGAAMIFIESQNEGSLLYTGDFCANSGSGILTHGYFLPSKIRPDVLLMCGLHAKHPGQTSLNDVSDIIPKINAIRYQSEPCLIPVRELTKGMEIVGFLVEKMNAGDLLYAPIFIDDYIWMLGERLRENGISVLGEQCRRFPPDPVKSGIYVGGYAYKRRFKTVCDFGFSLHASYNDCSYLISKLMPDTVVLVHSPKNDYNSRKDASLCAEYTDINFIYPKLGYLYDLN